MKLYYILVYELILIKIEQNDRVLTKKYFKLIARYENISKKELSAESIKIKKRYRDFKYIIVESTEKTDSYYDKLNEKSKRYYDMITRL